MVFDTPDMVGLARLAARTLLVEARQAATTSAATSASSSAAATAEPPAMTSTDPGNDGGNSGGGGSGGGGGGGSSPLLFFVALGFGVVFTNLWIIVGVKYCFRYNARNRNLRVTGEDGEPINLENMPQQPRRRRREKKLMSIDEVNEKFPMMKYKSWVASRAQEGLPTRGGISQPPSRAGSLRNADGIMPLSKEHDSAEHRPMSAGGTSLERQPTNTDPTIEHAEKTASETVVPMDSERRPGHDAASLSAPERMDSPASDDDDDEHDEEADHIHDAIPPDALESSGDTCAICIDTLEDDDDVRGLTCGHAFHAVCLDPWLTSRRACCPLCKADYYTPKPRPPAPEGARGTEVGPTVSINPDPRTNRANMPSRPGVAWAFPGRGRILPSWARMRGNGEQEQPISPRSTRRAQPGGFFSRGTTTTAAQPTRSANTTTEVQNTQGQSGGFLSNIRIPRITLPGRANNGNTAEVTPSNLEAGTRAGAR